MLLFLICAFSLLAGFIDSVVGGGGLIQIPAMLILFPNWPIATILGTNKLASCAGTTIAVQRYSRHVAFDWPTILPAAISAFVFAFLGSRIVSLLNTAFLKPIVLVLLVVVAIYVLFVKDLGLIHKPKHPPKKAQLLGILIGAGLGFYDGFFGPGTGSFLIFLFVGVFGFDFLAASASSKVINLATNLASVLYFGWTGHIIYAYAVPMALCSILGATIGARLAIAKGSRFVRIFFLVIVCALIAKLAQSIFAP
ncbi:MAG: sulfite exporter TauE/SafE family protein [Chthoniobacterales bacterium]